MSQETPAEKQTDFDKAQDAAALAVAVLPVFTQMLGAFGDFIAKLHAAHQAKKD